jgi:hypothetical protein
MDTCCVLVHLPVPSKRLAFEITEVWDALLGQALLTKEADLGRRKRFVDDLDCPESERTITSAY